MLLYSSEVWGAYDSTNPNKREKDPIERLHTQFYKNYLGLNKRAPNVVSRNETGRLPLQLNIFSRMIKFWLHLETLPENSVAKQCLRILHQLAIDEKPSFIFTINELLKKYNISPQNNVKPFNHYTDLQIIKNNVQKIKQQIAIDLKTHQMEII